MEFPASFLDKIFARQPPAHGCINALWQTRRSHSTQLTIAQAFARRNALCNCSQCAVAPLRRFPARPGICKGFGMALRRWSMCLFSGAGCAGKSQYRQNPIPVKPHLDKRRTQQNAGYQKTPGLFCFCRCAGGPIHAENARAGVRAIALDSNPHRRDAEAQR